MVDHWTAGRERRGRRAMPTALVPQQSIEDDSRVADAAIQFTGAPQQLAADLGPTAGSCIAAKQRPIRLERSGISGPKPWQPEPAWKDFADFKGYVHPRQPTFKG